MQTDLSPSVASGDVPSAEPVRVLYIAGIGRSGSTLLCRALGSVEGFVATGELMRIVDRGVGKGDLCSCGTPVRECRIWAAVWQRLTRVTPAFDFPKLEHTRHRVTESAEFLRYFVLDPPADLARDLDEYRRFLSALYRAVRDVTGARVVVDASKNLMFARLLTETPGLDVSVLHLVRDSRGVANSLAKRQPRPGTNGRHEHFRQFGPVLGSILWNTAQITTERIQARASGWTRLRYEDFVADPEPVLLEALQALYPAYAPRQLAHVERRALRLGEDLADDRGLRPEGVGAQRGERRRSHNKPACNQDDTAGGRCHREQAVAEIGARGDVAREKARAEHEAP
ncbi:MAG: sulfotransferase, partial [Vicinamibacteria bacterium]